MKIPVVTASSDVRYLRQVLDTVTADTENDGVILSKTDLLVLDGATVASAKSVVKTLVEVQGNHVPDGARPAPTVVDRFVRAAADILIKEIDQVSPIRDHAALIAASIAPAFHLFPYNRRLDTNGVDDALILSSAFCDIRQLVPEPVNTLIPQVSPVVPTTELTPLTPEIGPEASRQRESGSDTDDKIVDLGSVDELIAQISLLNPEPIATTVLTETIPMPVAAVSQSYRRNVLSASQKVHAISMSDQRRMRMVERVAFWVLMDMVRCCSTWIHAKDSRTISAIHQFACRILSGMRALLSVKANITVWG